MNCCLCVQEHYDYFSFSGANLMTLKKKQAAVKQRLFEDMD